MQGSTCLHYSITCCLLPYCLCACLCVSQTNTRTNYITGACNHISEHKPNALTHNVCIIVRFRAKHKQTNKRTLIEQNYQTSINLRRAPAVASVRWRAELMIMPTKKNLRNSGDRTNMHIIYAQQQLHIINVPYLSFAIGRSKNANAMLGGQCHAMDCCRPELCKSFVCIVVSPPHWQQPTSVCKSRMAHIYFVVKPGGCA